MKSLIIGLVSFLTSAQVSIADPLPKIEYKEIVLNCSEYSAISTDMGILFNNVWNQHAAKNEHWSQCLKAREVEGGKQYGWSWSWPITQHAVYAYPQIKLGASPWAPTPAMDNRFPLGIADLKSLTVSYDVEISGSGNYNLATSMWLIDRTWLVDRKPKGTTPDSSAIVAEVMIWTYSTEGHFNPGGKLVGEVRTGNTLWEVWVDKNWKDVSGQHENRWTYITYLSREHALETKIDIKQLLDYSVAEKHIDANLFIADVELGNEVMGGSGTTWIRSFQVNTDD